MDLIRSTSGLGPITWGIILGYTRVSTNSSAVEPMLGRSMAPTNSKRSGTRGDVGYIYFTTSVLLISLVLSKI
jgi:hypothetical protein